jgi:acetyl-CoA carboxylase carboxyl transferase subunit beta
MMDLSRKEPKYFTLPASGEKAALVPDNLWIRCSRCKELLYVKEFEKSQKVCQRCGFHFRLSARERLSQLLDAGSFEEWDRDVTSADPLGFAWDGKSYAEKIREARESTGLNEAAVSGRGLVEGQPLALLVLDFAFMGASMGSAVGEKVARAMERAGKARLPLLAVVASGGARMHEGLFSLLQLAKASVALSRFGETKLPYLTLFTDPCFGGVTASFASVADIIMAEPEALIGFAGPRVIEQITKQKLPPGFQTAEFLLKHGMVDMVVPRRELRDTLARLLKLYVEAGPVSGRAAAPFLASKEASVPADTFASKEAPWQTVQLARHPERPYTLDYVRHLFAAFVELHGDRRYSDDAAIVGGLARLGKRTVMVIGHQKGRSTKENVERHFGMAHPEGYRKALRLMAHAEKFGFPVITFIDTPGASPDMAAEERGQALAIAENLLAMAGLRVPLVAVIIGEGGSGGALALGVADRVLMLENAIYSVASPEACASILWRDPSYAPEAATAMKVTAQELYSLGLVDEVVPEPSGGAQANPAQAAQEVGAALARALDALTKLAPAQLRAERYAKYRRIGRYLEGNA